MLFSPHSLHRRVYPLRVLGMGLGGLVASVVLWGHDGTSAGAWIAVALPAVVWPHLAYQIARRSADPYRAELRNLLADSVFTGMWVPLMQFNLLPSVLLPTLTTVDKLTTGIRWLWAWSIAGMLLGAVVGGFVLGWPVSLESAMPVVVACLPVLVLHTLSVSLVSYGLIRKVVRQNQQLDELRRIDALTGLFGRGHWQEQAEAALLRCRGAGEPASMVMLDIDHFKQINDRWGHTVGDEVICAVAQAVRSCVRARDCAGRYGGDEFAILLPGLDGPEAAAVARRIHARIRSMAVEGVADLAFTSSIGVAEARRDHAALRDWMDAADAALYTAKREGRDRVAAGPSSAAVV